MMIHLGPHGRSPAPLKSVKSKLASVFANLRLNFARQSIFRERTSEAACVSRPVAKVLQRRKRQVEQRCVGISLHWSR